MVVSLIGRRDYTQAKFTAHSRIRMMCNAYFNLVRLGKELENGLISESDYTNAAAMDILAYSEQLTHLDDSFWATLPDDVFLKADLLRHTRNSMAHTYYLDRPEFRFVRSTASRDVPDIHRYVVRFYHAEDLGNNRNDLPTDYRYHHKERFTEKEKAELGYPVKHGGIINRSVKKSTRRVLDSLFPE